MDWALDAGAIDEPQERSDGGIAVPEDGLSSDCEPPEVHKAA